MEHDEELTEPDSNIRFIVPDSQLSDDSSQDLGLLPALKPPFLFAEETSLPSADYIASGATMSERKTKPLFKFSSPTESEVEEQGIILAAETANDTSDSSRSESDRNVTVVERVIAQNKVKQVDAISINLNSRSEKQAGDMPLISTPADKIRSLQFSGEKIFVPETVDSYDEVAPTPDAFGSIPMTIPDSPYMDDKDDENEDSGEITFRPVCPTIDQEYQLTTQVSTGRESQSIHLKLTPSQSDLLDTSDAEEITTENVIIEKTSTLKSPLLHERSQLNPVSEGSKLLPSFSFHASKDVENNEGSEDSMSVFRRVKASSTTPQKRKVILDDSDEFLPVVGSTSLKEKSGPISRSKQLPVKYSAKTSSSSKGQGKLSGQQDVFSSIENNTCVNDIVDLSSSFNAQLGGNVTEASSKHMDFDQTLSYDYITVKKSPSISHNTEAENIHIDNLTNVDGSTAQRFDITDSPEGFEHPSEAAEQSTVSIKKAKIDTVLEQLLAQRISLTEGNCSKIKHSHTETVLPSTPVTSKRTLIRENCGCEQPDHCPHRRDRQDEDSSKVDASKDLNDNTSVAHEGDDPPAVTGRSEEAIAVARDTTITTFSKVAVMSDISILRQSKSTDPYTFDGSQDQTVEGMSHVELKEQNHITAPRSKKRIKIMKKVFKKRMPPKVEADRSSAEDISNPDHNRKHPETRDPKVRARKQKSKKTVKKQTKEKQQQQLVVPEHRQEQENQQQQQQQNTTVAKPTQFTALHDKTHFNKPFDPDTHKAGPSTSRNESSTHETQQIHIEGHTKIGDSGKSSKKTTTSTDVAAELSDSSEHEVERITVQTIYTSVFITTENTIIEVHSSKGTLLQRTERSVEVDRRLAKDVKSEKVTERIIIPQLSPSRSVSTMTTGDLADISSFLSKVSSSGSKSSNPSIDVAHYEISLPTPAQRQHTFEKQDTGKLQQVDECRRDADLPGAGAVAMLMPIVKPKRHSASSSTGKDLFSTPDQSIIDRADSDLGKVVSSTNSTPCSQSLISPSTAIGKPDHEGRTKITTSSNTRNQGALTHFVPSSIPLRADNDVRPPASTSVCVQPVQACGNEGATVVQGQSTSVEKVIYRRGHRETPGRQDVHNVPGKQTVKSDSGCVVEQSVEDLKSSKSVSKKRKMSDAETSKTTPQLQKIKRSGKLHAEIAREDIGESTDVQSTGFSVHGGPPSASGGSPKDPPLIASSKSSAGFSCSPEIPLQGGLKETGANMVVLKEFKSKAVQGAKVMGKWKDGYYYPGILSKVDHFSKKYMLNFDDGSQRLVKANEIILAAELPVGQSVMVLSSNDFYEPGMVMGHSEAQSEGGPANFIYHVERDDGITQMCERKSLILSEGQAACLLSDDEMRISQDACTPSTSKAGDISLDNLVEGKRHLKSTSTKAVSNKEDQPSVSGVQPTSKAAPNSTIEGENCQSGKKRKEGPVATSTPTPKQICKGGKRQGTPVKRPVPYSLGGAVASPHDSRKVQRKARMGLLFETSPSKKSKLFEGMTFILTHVDKSAEDRKQERLLQEDSSLETSTDNNTDVGIETASTSNHSSSSVPFVKDHLQNIIENGGGQVIQSISDVRPDKNCYLVAAEHQRTVKYLQALAAGMTMVSHQWILQSVAMNGLQPLTPYILPAGISLETRKLMERTGVCSDLANHTVMVVSNNKEFIEAWTSILKIAHSPVVTRFPSTASKNDPGVDVVVSDSSCPSTIVRRCQQLDVPLVSSEWVAQCLINGHRVDFKGHEKYKHDFSS